jgi:hypothetical protein
MIGSFSSASGDRMDRLEDPDGLARVIADVGREEHRCRTGGGSRTNNRAELARRMTEIVAQDL